MRECVRAYVRACVRASVRPCVRPCVRASVRPCVRASVRAWMPVETYLRTKPLDHTIGTCYTAPTCLVANSD